MKFKQITVFLFTLLAAIMSWAQVSSTIVINGAVKDKNGLFLGDVSVTEKGTNNSVITDEKGSFRITVKTKTAELLIRFVGFETKTVKAIPNTLIVLDAKIEELQEVAVIGYSSKNRIELSSSVAVVSGEKLRDVTSNELTSLLQGKAPGVVVSTGSGDPTSGSNVLIRGAGTINASTSPLYVVDGNIGGIFNPNDIESVTILKDAAATGLYGSRAANGVIIVTTKSGKLGKAKIEFSSTVGLSEATTGNFHLMNSQQLYDYQKTFYNPNPASLNTNTDWWNIAFRRALVHSYNLAASGGTDKTNYYISGNYYNEDGTLIHNNKKAYSFRSNLSHRLTERLKVSVLLNGIYTKDTYNPAGAVSNAYLNMPFDSAYNADGTHRDARYGTWYGRDRNNFLHALDYNFSNAKSFNATGDLNLDYKISTHFSFATYNRANLFSYRSDAFNDKRSKAGATDAGSVSNTVSSRYNLLTSNRLKYANKFGNHGITALAVAEVEKSYYEDISTYATGLPPGRAALSTSTGEKKTITGGVNESMFSKYLAQADYNYVNKYFLVASFVNEYSSRFGNNNPSANFYQLGASWIISNESFMRVQPISFLKLRVSYGTTGNADGIGDYAALGLYSISQAASYASAPGAAPSQKANPNLTWESMTTSNIGVDISLFKRIDISVDAYNRVSNNLLFFRALPATSGYDGVYENVGSIRNHGLEFNITSRNLTRELTWETNLNMSFNRNKVLSVNQGRTEVSTGARQPVAVGRDMDEWYMPVWAGVNPANGEPLWEKLLADGDGNNYIIYTNSYNAATRQYINKSSAPKFTGGITNTFSYKNFTFTAFLNFVYGNSVYNESRFYFDNDGLYESYNQMQLAKGWNRWQKPGDIATHPKPIHGRTDASNASSTRYLEDGSYIRLRNIRLSYDLPNRIISKAKLSSVRFFVSGDNMWTLSNFTGVDPEVVLSTGESSIKYPISKKILFGLNISF